MLLILLLMLLLVLLLMLLLYTSTARSAASCHRPHSPVHATPQRHLPLEDRVVYSVNTALLTLDKHPVLDEANAVKGIAAAHAAPVSSSTLAHFHPHPHTLTSIVTLVWIITLAGVVTLACAVSRDCPHTPHRTDMFLVTFLPEDLRAPGAVPSAVRCAVADLGERLLPLSFSRFWSTVVFNAKLFPMVDSFLEVSV